MAQVGYRMFKTFNIAVDKAQDVLTHMCHLYEVSEEKSRSRRSSFTLPGGKCSGARFLTSRLCDRELVPPI